MRNLRLGAIVTLWQIRHEESNRGEVPQNGGSVMFIDNCTYEPLIRLTYKHPAAKSFAKSSVALLDYFELIPVQVHKYFLLADCAGNKKQRNSHWKFLRKPFYSIASAACFLWIFFPEHGRLTAALQLLLIQDLGFNLMGGYALGEATQLGLLFCFLKSQAFVPLNQYVHFSGQKASVC